MNIAQEAYEAYANHTGWKSLATGANLPQWDKLPDAIKAAWQVSAGWVAGRVSGQHDWLIPAKDELMADRITQEAMSGNNEVDHMKADDLLCKLLADLGCDKTVEAFGKVGKWYV